MKPSPSVFLDFDGVLHHANEDLPDSVEALRANPRLFQWLPHLAEALAPHPCVRIIISSNWRRWFDDASLRLLLGDLGSRFDGVVATMGHSRVEEIWMEIHKRRLERWLAIDDHDSVHAVARRDKRFIACHPEFGLSSANTQADLRSKLLTIFGKTGSD
ncbi:MAG TPA: HAD domain-containing protein [Noviherbaspirillum sp.]